MSNDRIKLSYQPLILQGAGAMPTVPSSPELLPGDTGWNDATDILVGQTAFNVTDNKFYIRNNDGITDLKSTMYHVHDQGVPSAVWTINHKLNCRPNVTVTDSTGVTYVGEVTYVNNYQVKVEFNGGFSGKAYLT